MKWSVLMTHEILSGLGFSRHLKFLTQKYRRLANSELSPNLDDDLDCESGLGITYVSLGLCLSLSCAHNCAHTLLPLMNCCL